MQAWQSFGVAMKTMPRPTPLRQSHSPNLSALRMTTIHDRSPRLIAIQTGVRFWISR